jgi:nucleoid DNA-binding protein
MEKIVGKRDLIDEVTAEAGFNREDVQYVYEILMLVINKHLDELTPVRIHKLGLIDFIDVKGRKSNMTGTIIPDHRRIRFRFSHELKKKIKSKFY